MAKYLPTLDEVREFRKIPCMRDSLLRGLGGGIGLGIVWGVVSRQPRRVGDGIFLGFTLFASASWLLCRRNDRVRREAVYRMMMSQSRPVDPDLLEKSSREDTAAVNEAVMEDVRSLSKKL